MSVTMRKKTYLRLAGVAIMARHSNLVKELVQLVDDGRDLLLQIAGVHAG
jgi:hypothetical protein